MSTLLPILVGVGLVLGGLVGYVVRHLLSVRAVTSAEEKTKAKLESAEERAKKILLEAENKAADLLAEARREGREQKTKLDSL